MRQEVAFGWFFVLLCGCIVIGQENETETEEYEDYDPEDGPESCLLTNGESGINFFDIYSSCPCSVAASFDNHSSSDLG